jgi:hypothetical protein
MAWKPPKGHPTKYAREATIKTTVQRSTAVREESLDEFLASFSKIVAVAAVEKVKTGQSTFIDAIPGGGHLEKALKEEAAKAALTVEDTKFVEGAAIKVEEQWPDQEHAIYQTAEHELRSAALEQEKKDSASVISKAAESVISRISKTVKPDGPADLPSALLITGKSEPETIARFRRTELPFTDARQTKERVIREKQAAGPVARRWGQIRESMADQGKKYLASRGFKYGHYEKTRDAAMLPDNPEYVPPVDAKDAVYEAAIEAYKRQKEEEERNGGSSGAKQLE